MFTTFSLEFIVPSFQKIFYVYILSNTEYNYDYYCHQAKSLKTHIRSQGVKEVMHLKEDVKSQNSRKSR